MNEEYKKLGIAVPEVLLPKDGLDLNKWSVVACDQYTSEADYWENVKSLVGSSPSTLNLIYPEVYLEETNNNERINKINKTMEEYLKAGILQQQKPALIFIDRKTNYKESRKGLIAAVDLECYDYNKGSQTLIRATEGTVLDRLPPRIRIREHAPIELPHIMLLIDDPEKSVIEPLSKNLDKMRKIYDFDLMMEGGHISGYAVENEKLLKEILNALNNLASPDNFRKKYGVDKDKGVLLFAAGDGNHSLASAKGHWENVKKTLDKDSQINHPARYALVEIVNVHDYGLEFEPIHRVLFNVDHNDLINSMLKKLEGCNISLQTPVSHTEIETLESNKDGNIHKLPYVTHEGYGIINVQNPTCNLAVGTLQNFLDQYVKENPKVKIDYIHGAEVVNSLGSQKGNMGFFLPSMDKNDLFKTVILDGVLPRKTFSMGEASEKRFYLECRKIK